MRALVAAAAVLVAVMLSCAPAQARLVHVNGQTYGVFSRPAAAVAPAGHAKGETQVPLTYGGGPVMLQSKFYAIYWGASASFPAGYENTINQYLGDLQVDSGKLTNDYSVSTQYCQDAGANGFSACPAGSQHITSENTFVTAFADTNVYPSVKNEGCQGDANPCVSDAQVQTELQSLIKTHAWETDAASAPVAQYLVFFPPGVDSCMGVGDCTFSATNGFCGYHGEISNVNSSGNIAIYSNDPFESGCDSGNDPSGASSADADGALDTLVHELNESTTDPENGTGWTDTSGNEEGDKCENGAINNGLPLGGSATATPPTLYNQVINGHRYYTQTLWSNAAEQTPSGAVSGCLQRLGASPVFLPPTGVAAGKPELFDASDSFDVAHAITSYVWNFGDGTGNVTGEQVTHTFATGGTYTVTLTVSDSSGNASTETMSVTVPKLEISQLRPGASASSEDSYVELYNPTGSTVSLTGWHLLTLDDNFDVTQNVDIGADTGGGSVAPNGYLLEGGSNYSLSAYAPLDDANLSGLLPNTTVLLEDPSGNVDDAVCLCGTSISATGLGTFSGTGQYAFLRQLHTGAGGTLGSTGTPQFTGSNPQDFALLAPEADGLAGSVLPAIEGSPGPHATGSPVIVNPKIGVALLAGTNPNASPNQQVVTGGPTSGASRTLYLRRTITNNTGSPITALRFRVTRITTGSTPAPLGAAAILRVVSDPGGSVTFNSTAYPFTAMSLDAPATSNTDGGGLNASLTVPSITPSTPLASGASIHVEFKLGVQRGGQFSFFFNTEASG